MASRSQILFFLLLVLPFFSYYAFAPISASGEAEEQFNEELLLRPLPDRKVLAHFSFGSRARHSDDNGGHHLRLFPKAIYQLVRKFHIKEMELSFTQGRWNYEAWGGFDPIPNNNVKPPGVELWAVFDSPPSHVDALWSNLTHTLSGLFCASINFLESSTSYSAPKWGFRTFSGSLRYGSLPREAVCTENLTPWLKLLPCRDKAGLSELMDRPSIYRGFYHSQRLRLTSSQSSSIEHGYEVQIEQTLTVVLQPGSQKGSKVPVRVSKLQPSWSMSSLFGKTVNARCVLAKSSNVYLQLERGLVSELKDFEKNGMFNIADFELSTVPDGVIKEINKSGKGSSVLYQFLLEKHVAEKPFNLGLTWKQSVNWKCSQAPLHASRYLMGSGNERGAIAISLKSTKNTHGFLGTERSNEQCKLHVGIFQVVPWYVKVYYHTMQIYVNGKLHPVTDFIEKIQVSPSEDKVSPGVLELLLKFPCDMQSAELTLEFDKGFLHIDEYPPDANQGFDIPSAVITFPDFQSNLDFQEGSIKSPLVSRLQEKSPSLAYTEVLLVPLTTPDFSMPYNVTTITCTVFALYFGSLLNVLRRRAGEEERQSKDGAAKKKNLLSKLLAKLRGKPTETSQSQPSSSTSTRSKLILKVILVAGIAIVWQFYLQ
ncbi:hypothetical protein V2J09_002139 [Rumex salicifolius]